MIPAGLLLAVAPVTAARPVSGRADAPLLLPQLEPGDLVAARVEDRLSDGNFKVMVAGQALRMTLPAYVEPGDTLELALVTREPRLTFSLKEAGDAAQQAELSTTGKLVSAAMSQPGARPLPLVTAIARPLLLPAPGDGNALATTLFDTLAQSGLFYESHLAEWLAGRRDLAQIFKEPQARLASPPQPPPAPAGDLASAAQAPAERSPQLVHPQALPLVQQQLGALDAVRVALQLEIWPRQWLQWEIEEQPERAPRSAAAAHSWNTRLRLELPRLGSLQASLTLAGDSLSIRIEADRGESAALLLEARPALRAALSGAGMADSDIAVGRHETA